MTAQSNAELYPCLYCNGHEDETDCIEAIKKEAQRQLLQELLEQKKEFESRIDDVPVYLHAVPVSVIQNKLEGLS